MASKANWRRAALAWLGLAAATLATLWPLGLTNRVLAGIDAYTYFTPYWAYRMAALRSGHLPLWNPFIFLGVPFLANPQAAVLYPLHWPLSWLASPAQALVWSALLHVWLAAGFTYTFARRGLGLSYLAALLTGLLFGLGGYNLARIENINQLNALAWLPAMLWLYEETARSRGWRQRVRWGSALACATALAILAGHTQATFIDLVGTFLYAVASTAGLWRAGCSAAQAGSTNLASFSRAGTRRLLASRLLPFVAILAAVPLAAAQLLPTLELNSLGPRAAGLPWREAASFSLRPRLLAQSLLPPFGGGLPVTFGSESYPEFVGYLSASGLFLAAMGLFPGRRRRSQSAAVPQPGSQEQNTPVPAQYARIVAIVLAAAGLLLALGGYDPLYYLAWRFVPGFALFRVPARWLALYALGAATLAGLGLDRLTRRCAPGLGPPAADGQARSARWAGVLASVRRPPRPLPALLCLAGLGLILLQQYPRWPVVAGWLLAALAAGGLWLLGQRPGREPAARLALLAITLGELWLAGRALPFTLATAPSAVTGLRNAPAALLAATAGEPPAGRGRFLSLSNIQYDPGDLNELRALEADRLSPDALDRFVRAAKQLEVVSPNLSMLLGLPAVDGYDGGVLPLARYLELGSLIVSTSSAAPTCNAAAGRAPASCPASTPQAPALPDGRLREQLHQIPPDRLLDLTGTRYVVTDKQNDLWAGDVYYDLEQPVALQPGQSLSLDLARDPAFSATTLGLISYIDGPVADGTQVAQVLLTGQDGRQVSLTLTAPNDTAWSGDTRANAGTVAARQWPDWMGAGRDALAIRDFPSSSSTSGVGAGSDAQGRPAPCPLTPVAIRIVAAATNEHAVVLRGLSLIDRRTGAHESITLSPRGDRQRIYSGDVKIYERLEAPGHAWLVHSAATVPDDAGALARLADPAFDPRTMAVITLPPGSPGVPGLPTPASVAKGDGAVAAPAALAGYRAAPASAGSDRVIELAYDPERIVLQASTAQPALLVLADAAYPGWMVTVDGRPAPLLTANLMFRGVVLGPGSHNVTFTYQPASWRIGLALSLAAVALLVVAACATLLKPPSAQA